MLKFQPFKAKAARKGSRRKSVVLLALSAFAWLGIQPAFATIDDTVVATGDYQGAPLTSTSTKKVDVVNQISSMLVNKTGTINDGGDGHADLGDTISYVITVTNNGNVTLKNVTLTDPLIPPGAPSLTGDVAPSNDSFDTIAAGWDTLAPGDALTYTALYTLTQPDVDANRVQNTATANATTVPGVPVTSTGTAITPFNVFSAIALEKTGVLDMGPNGRADPGDAINYTFKVTNTGTTTLTNVKVSDPLVNFSSLAGHDSVIALLAASQSADASIQTASIDAVNAPASQPYRWFADGRSYNTIDLPQLAASINATRKLVNMTGKPVAPVAGDRVGIYFDLTNTGEAPLTGIGVSQEKADAFGDTLDILAPNATSSAGIIFTAVLTDADIASGTLNGAATIKAHARGQDVIASLSGPMALADMKSFDELATATILPASVPTLAPAGIANFTAVYHITQADIDAGHVFNAAVASGTTPTNEIINANASFDAPVPQAPAIALLKTGTANLGTDGVASVGDTITYKFTVSNPGNTTLLNVSVADPLPGIVMTGSPIASLAPGASNATTYSGTYILTQVDVDAGRVVNQATATGTPPGAGAIPVTDLSDPTSPTGNTNTIVTLAAQPKIALIKKVSSVQDVNINGRSDVGDIVHYTFNVQNTGNVTLTNVYVRDRNPAAIAIPLPPTGVTLAPAAIDTTTFSATYTLTQVDVDRGFYDNTADTYGTDPNGTIVTDASDPAVYTGNAPTHQVIPAVPGIAIIKTQTTIDDLNGNTLTDIGDVIHYGFTVTNTGNVTLSNVIVTDPKAVIAGGPIATMLPGVVNATTFTGTHTVTNADMLAGQVVNQATATGRAPSGATTSDLSDSARFDQDVPTVTAIIVKPAIAIVKQVTGITDVNTNSIVDAGDIINYVFSVKNTGNVTLNGVTVTDPLVSVSGGPIASLLPGNTNTTTFTASYVLTPADITAGTVTNQATAIGTSPTGTPVSDLSDYADFNLDRKTVTYITNSPSIAVVKTITGITDTNGSTTTDVGDVIHYAFALTNTGNVALTNVTLADPNAIIAGGPLLTLGLSATDSATFTGTHVLTQPDVDAGSVSNQATATGHAGLTTVTDLSDNSTVTGSAPTVITLDQSPGIALVKTMSSVTDANGNGRTDTGDTVNYAFAVTNTGNVTLTNITITDINATVIGGPLATLAPGATNTTTFRATHVVTLADSDAEQITNQATALAKAPGNVTISDLSDDNAITGNDPTVTSVSAPLPVLTKTAAKSEVKRGEQVVYTITASSLRTGPYDIADIMPPGFSYVDGSATINTVAATPSISGNTLAFAAIAPNPADGTITLKVTLLASTTLSTGEFINKARLYLNATGDLLATAQAKVKIKPEHVFDCGEIIGRVFDDLNGNGYMDEGEPGMPGVRIATVKGVLITTDKNGLYHISCADIPDASIGSNFLLKLDPRTLPEGYHLTTENPRDVRLTRGKVTKLNFGVWRTHNVQLALTRDAFVGNSTDLKPKWQSGIDRLVKLLHQGKGDLTIVYRCGVNAPIVDDRLSAVAELVDATWQQAGDNKPLKITTRVECGK
jgi:uncharacterized repeat protein (TIGR01451 family)